MKAAFKLFRQGPSSPVNCDRRPCVQYVRLQVTFRSLVAFVATIITIALLRNDIRDLYHPWATYIHCKAAGIVDDKQGLKRILFYTPWFGRIQWPLESELSLPCRHKCLITYNKCELPFSDAVVFHGYDLKYGRLGLKRIAEKLRRSPQQRWVYYTHENPHNLNHDPTLYNGIFNWTVTYRSDSDIFRPYGHYKALERQQNPNERIKSNYAKGKDGLIAWAVSHCGTVRDKVVQKLLQFLPVTIIGACSELFNQVSPEACKRGSPSCSSYLKRFKFYLAFENGMCHDYITEKYWGKPHDHNMVPVVLGSNYDDKVAIPGSYINILDFPNMRAFSDYIKYLDTNDTAYNEYFSWRTMFTLDKTLEDQWLCTLCVNLYNDSLPRKVYTNLGAYFGVKSNCYRNKEKIQRLLH